jgi:mono/diheme cytochrome c family protein
LRAGRFAGESTGTVLRRMFDVPWDPDPRLEPFFKLTEGNLGLAASGHGVIARPNGSLLYGTRIPDLQILRYSRYADATGTHRLRGPEDVARYGALITGADPMTFGTHRMLPDSQRHVKDRYADEVLYAIGVYLLSLEPPKNPNPPPADLVKRGQQVFEREKCGACHPAPNYTTGELTPALGFDVPDNHPNLADVREESVGTDPGLAMRTRKGTGFYKIPTLRGLWYRPRLLHDASITTLEELFDAARLDPEYERKGWSPPGVTKGAIRGLEFLTRLSPEDKAALIAFLRSL